MNLTMMAVLICVSTNSFAAHSRSSASAEINSCAGNLIEKLTYHPGRAEKLCSNARKVGTDTSQFSTCVVDISAETKMQPEIIAPYCMKRADLAYKDCVISTFKSNSNSNAFKSCMKSKLSHVAALKHSEVQNREIQTAPISPSVDLKSSVGYVRSAYDLQD